MTDDRIDSLLGELTLPEKIGLVHGDADPDGRATGYLPPVERLGIPPLRLVDGPLGVRVEEGKATAFPSSVALAATWKPSLAREQGAAMGREARAYDQDVLLGPGVNIVRAPQCGRNFEYYSEEPHLASRFAVEMVGGIQSEGVAATVKHYVANNQETNRYDVSAEVSERALREVYLPAFRAAIEEADAGAVMTAYNRINGVHASEHAELLGVLREEFGFDGVAMSDWYGTESTVDAAIAGLDLEMPGATFEELAPAEAFPAGVDPSEVELPDALPDMHCRPYFGDALRDAVERGDIDEGVLDAKVRRILGTMERFGLLVDGERAPATENAGALDAPKHRDLAFRIAVEGTALLRNDSALPLADDDSVAVIGPNADEAKLGGGGSSEVTPFVRTSPLEGLRGRAAECRFERGVERIPESSLFDELPFGGREDAEEDRQDGPAPDLDAAVEAAAAADCAVVVVQDDVTEGEDKADLRLPGNQDALVEAVADDAERTVVVVRSGGPVELPWLDAVDAIVETWYPGQAEGEALAAVLFGDADPGGRLPVTFTTEDEYPTSAPGAFPGDDAVRYAEGVFVGYRYVDREGVDPTFPFGHGESYAEFAYGDPTATVEEGAATVSVPVENVADRPGREVVQVYFGEDDPTVPRPERELAGFEAVRLDPGERATVEVPLSDRGFAYYDEDDSEWVRPSGPYTAFVGRSSRDVRGTASVALD